MMKTRAFLLLLAAVLLLSCAALTEENEGAVIQPISRDENIFLPEGLDLSQLSYDQLIMLRQAVEERITDMDRQFALENADRRISFEQPEIRMFSRKNSFQNPTIEMLKETAPARTILLWTSSDPAVATVNEYGRVNSLSGGTATITATVKDNPYLSASYTVRVLVPLEKISVMGESDTLLLGGDPALAETWLSIMAEPEDAHIPPVTWSSSAPEIASVDADGRVTGHTAGRATITATVAEEADLGSRAKQLPYPVNVVQSVTGVTLDMQSLALYTGNTYNLIATVLPENAANKTLSWASSNEAVVKVDAAGKLTAQGGGEADVTAEARDGSGVMAVCHVTVTQPVSAIAVTDPADKALKLTAGDVWKVTVMVLPETASYQELVWTSSNVLVARVADGSVEAVGAGDCIITCAALDGSGVSAQIDVHVASFRVAGDAFTVIEKTGLTIPVSCDAGVAELELTDTGKAFIAYLDENKNIVITPENAGEGTVILNNPAAPADRQEIRITVESSAVYDETSYPKISYADIVRNPFAYINTPMSITGKILQIRDENESVITLTIGTAGNDYSDQVLWAKVPVDVMPKGLADDTRVTLYGIFQMEQLYSESLQSNTLIPAIVTEKVKVKTE